MQLTRNLRLAVAGLLALHLASASAAIAILGRVQPAVDMAFEHRAESQRAVEGMLVVLASPTDNTSQDRFERAWQRAWTSLDGDEDRARLKRVQLLSRQAFAGADGARTLLLDELSGFGTAHRDELQAAQSSAERLGTGGAWAVVFLALLTLGGALAALRRMDRRVLIPLEEIHDVLGGWRRGDAHRRCRPARGAASELARAMASLNEVLDDRQEALVTATAAERVALIGGEEVDHVTLLRVMDLASLPMAVVDVDGEVLAANAAALDRLASESPGVRTRLRQLIDGGEASSTSGITTAAIDGTSRHLCTWSG
jgi:hypothetical protein